MPFHFAVTTAITILQESPGGNSQDDESASFGTLPNGPAENKKIQLFDSFGYPSDPYSGPVPCGTELDNF